MNKIKYIALLFFLNLFFCGQSQQFGSNVIDKNPETQSGQSINSKKPFSPEITVSLGSSFTSFGHGYNAFSTFIMPELTLPVNNQFSISAGLGYSTLFFPGNENFSSQQNLYQFGSVYVSGLYRVNEKLSVAGTAYKTFPLSDRNQQTDPRAAFYSNEGLMLDVNYKVNEHLIINAGISYGKQNPYNFYQNTNQFNNFGSPFQPSFFEPSF